MKLIKIITILLIYILITLIVTKIYFKQYDYFTTKYGYRCAPCEEFEAGQYLDGCSGTNAGTCRDMYYVVPDVDQNSEGANRGIANLSQEEYCKNNVNANECGNCNTKARECEETQYLDGCGVDGSPGECSDCTCPDGEYKLGCAGLQGGVCESCNTLVCEVGKYLTGCGGKEPGRCQQCPINSTSPSGSNSVEACQCEEGYSGPDGGPCTACLAGTYKDSIGDGYCQACEEGTYQNLPGQSECDDCPTNMTSPNGSDSVEDCVCDKGYELINGVCTECQEGFYKTEVGNSSCLPCEAGKYKADTGPGTCTPCEEGSFNENEGSGECQQCPDNMTSPYGSDSVEDCVCDKGYELINGVCTECQEGTYKDTIGNNTCKVCAGLRPASGKYYHNCGGDSMGTLTDCPYDSCETDEYLYGCGRSNSGICRKCNTAYIWGGGTVGRTHYYPSCGDGELGEATRCTYYSRSNQCQNNNNFYFWGCIGEYDGECYSCMDRCGYGRVALGCGNGNMGRCESCYAIEANYCSDRSDGRTTLYGCGGQDTGYCGCPDGMYWAWSDRVCRWPN